MRKSTFTSISSTSNHFLQSNQQINRRRNTLLRPRGGVLVWSVGYLVLVAATTFQAMIAVERQSKNKPLKEKYYEAILKLPPM